MATKKPSKRKAEEAAWEVHRDIINQLYITERRPIPEVQQILAGDPYNFRKTKPQFERILQKWGLRKHLTKSDWINMKPVLGKRKADGKTSAVYFQGNRIPDEKVHRETNRYQLSTYDQFKRQRTDHFEYQQGDIIIRTPSPDASTLIRAISLVDSAPAQSFETEYSIFQSPTPSLAEPLGLVTLENQLDSPLALSPLLACYSLETSSSNLAPSSNAIIGSNLQSSSPQLLEITALYFQDLPWIEICDFIDLYINLRSPSPDPVISSFFDVDAYCSKRRFLHVSTESLTSLHQHWFLKSVQMLQAQIPGSWDGGMSISVHNLLNKAPQESQLDFIKLITYLLSNNMNSLVPEDELVNIFQDQQNLHVLDMLLRRSCATITSFAEKLLVIAFRMNEKGLASHLLQSRVSIYARYRNYQLLTDFRHWNWELQLMLLHEIEKDHKNIKAAAESFLKPGLFTSNKDIHPKVFTKLANLGLKLQVGDHGGAMMRSILMRAVILDDVKFIQSILQSNLEACQLVYNETPSLFHVAASYGSIEMMRLLVYHGIPPKARQPTTLHGEGLVLSSTRPSLKMFKLLLSLGADVNVRCTCIPADHINLVPGDEHDEETEHEENENGRRFRLNLGATALEMAVWGGKHRLVELLLNEGATPDPAPNQVKCMTVLQIAALGGNISLVRRLLNSGADVNAYREEFSPKFTSRGFMGTAMGAATISGNVDVFMELLNANPCSNPCKHDSHALLGTYHENNIHMLTLLIQNGADFEEAWKLAILEADDEFLLFLLYQGCSPLADYEKVQNAVRKSECAIELLELAEGGATPFLSDVHWQSSEAQGPRARNFPAFPNPPSWLTTRKLRNYLRRSIYYSSTAVLRVLVKYNMLQKSASDTACPLRDGLLGLHDALKYVRFGDEEIGFYKVDLLATFGADCRVNPPLYNRTDTLLSSCIMTGSSGETVKNLISRGMDPNVIGYANYEKGPSGVDYYSPTTALEAAVLVGDVDIVRMLLDVGARVNSPAGFPDGRTVLQSAVETLCNGGEDLIEKLLEAGADVNSPPAIYKGATALQFAAGGENLEAVRRLLEAGADVNSSPAPWRGATALQFAAARGNYAIVRMLVDVGADINAPPAKVSGFTALEGAALNGKLDMARYLLNAGADIRGTINSQFRRAVGLAWNEGHRPLANYLQEYKRTKYGLADCQPLNEILEAPDVKFWDDDEYWEKLLGLEPPWKSMRQRSESPEWDSFSESETEDNSTDVNSDDEDSDDVDSNDVDNDDVDSDGVDSGDDEGSEGDW